MQKNNIYNATFDLGGSSIKVLIFDSKDNIYKEDIIYNNNFEIKKRIDLHQILETINNYIKKLKINCQVGLSIPGLVDSKKNKVLSYSAYNNIEININNIFNKNTYIKKLIIENDSNAAGIGEYVYGQNKQINDFILITIGTAIGCSIFIDKKIYKGKHFASGEVLSINVNMLENFSFNNTGFFWCGTFQALKKYQLRTGIKVNGKEFMNLVEQNNLVALEIFETWTTAVANLVINIYSILDISNFYIGGGISKNQQFIKVVKQKAEAFNNYINDWRIEKNEKYIVLDKAKNNNYSACYGLLSIIKGEYKYE